MSFFKSRKKAEDLKQSGGSYINKSGMYPVEILAPIVNVSEKGSTAVDMFLEYKGKEQVLYGNLRISNNNGDENEIGSKTFNQLVIISDADSVEDPIEVDLPIGKKGAIKSAAVLEDLTDVSVIIRVQMEYSVWNDEIQEKKIIKGFYRDDKASAEEIVMETEIGVQYEKDLEYADNVTYKDDLTEEEVKAWISSNRKGSAKSSSKAETSRKARGSSFGKKRSKAS